MAKERGLTAERESAILDAAQRRFAHFGLSKVTMDEIALDVGLGKASLYYYFPTKDDIFRAVLGREEKAFLASLKEITVQEISPEEKLKLFAAQRLDIFRTFLNLSQFEADGWFTMRPSFQAMLPSIEKEELRFLTAILRDGERSGAFAVKNPHRAATLILYTLQGLRLRALKHAQVPGGAPIDYAELGRQVQELLEMILAGLHTPKRS